MRIATESWQLTLGETRRYADGERGLRQDCRQHYKHTNSPNPAGNNMMMMDSIFQSSSQFKILVAAIAIFALRSPAIADSPRQILSLDDNWKFHLGDLPDASKPDYDDRAWRTIDVPHDYVIEGAFDPKVQAGMTAHWYENHASLHLQPAWYRKVLSAAPLNGQHVWIEFDGVFSNSTCWLNGHELGSEHSGYSSFRYDITDSLKTGSNNILAVHVDPHYDGWWYEGGGIYRHVRMVIVDPVHISPWGVFFAPFLQNTGNGIRADAVVNINSEIVNQATSGITATVLSEVLDADRKVVATGHVDQSLAAGATSKVPQQISLISAALWTLENPYLYQLRTTIKVAGKAVDQIITNFGVRQEKFDPDKGFFLNGKHVEIQGVNCHQDHAGVGVAMPDRLIEWRLQKLKEVGCNAIRMSHNPVSPVMMDLCDRMGFLVIAENRHLGDTYADQSPKNTTAVEHHDLTTLVMRDRNHPCIILWSLCNEQWTQGTPEAAAMAKAMKQRVNQLDGTRPVTAAMNGGWDKPDGMSSVLDVAGINYNPAVYQGLHEKFPTKPYIATEIASEIGTRGIYDMNHWANYWGDKVRGYVAAYSINAGPGGQTVENAWPPVAEHEFIAGGFVWSGFDYKGEPRPFGWPCIGSHYGMMDVCGFPKDSYYYYRSWWTNNPVLHVFPHWNWPGKEGQEIPVWVQSNCQEVELFLNDVSQGKQTVKPLHHLEWKIKYVPGKLVARGIRDGKPIESMVETAGEPAAVRLTADRTAIAADNNDLAVVTVEILDAQGRVVPVADNLISFTINGPGKLIGVGNGDPSCHDPDKATSRKAFNGLAQAIVQSTHDSGEITLTANAAGLTTGTVHLTTHKSVTN